MTDTKQAGPHAAKFLTDFHKQTKREHALLGSHGGEEEGDAESARWISIIAGLMLLLGTCRSSILWMRLTISLLQQVYLLFSSHLATNSNEAVSVFIFASRKKQTTASLTFYEIYGAVIMNNIFAYPVFLALVYLRGLTWDFSAELLVILSVCMVMGISVDR